MKKLFIVLSIIFNFTSCHNDDDNDKATITNPVNQLPPATQTGANTAGCLVNGNVFLPRGNGIILNCFYQDGLNFCLGIAENINNSYKSIAILSQNQNLVQGQTYQLRQSEPDSQFAEYSINSEGPPSANYYSTTSLITGELKITHHDFERAIISGTFWFDSVNSHGDTLAVRNGRFDMHY